MDGMEFVLVILFLFVAPIVFIAIWTGHKQQMAKMASKLTDTEKERLNAELASVKSRLEVLEAIVTDKKYQLKQEIEELQSPVSDRLN